MPTNLAKMSDKELNKLSSDIAREKKNREKSKLDEARKAAEAAAKKHGFKLTDLMGGSAPRAGKPAKRAPSPAKYANPDDRSQTWSGRGRQPAWFKSAVAAGKDPKSMEI